MQMDLAKSAQLAGYIACSSLVAGLVLLGYVEVVRTSCPIDRGDGPNTA
jgi:hypothetical protein